MKIPSETKKKNDYNEATCYLLLHIVEISILK